MTHKLLSGIAIACFFVLGWLSAAHAVILEVKDGNLTCINADISANFTITYNVSNGTQTVVVPLPASTNVGNDSSCKGAENSQDLQASFGDGHFLNLVFTSSGDVYRIANLTLSYNLSDDATFPQSSSKGIMVLSTNTSQISAQLNTTYRCFSSSTVNLGGLGVTITFFNIHIQAYMPNANLSTNETVCSADVSTTTTAPTTTTTAPTTTTIAPTTPITPANPDSGNYSVADTNGTTCLLARMGLQLNVTYMSKSQNKSIVEIMNLQPNKTFFYGSCESTTASLILNDSLTALSFTFTLNSTTNKYHLSTLNMSANWPDMNVPISVSNSSLQYMVGTLGRSYMCNVEEVIPVVSNFSLNIFDLQVQPFAVRNKQFGPADECQMQKDNMLVPIIVGASLAGLVLIVLIAYLIGRKRSHAGYQTI